MSKLGLFGASAGIVRQKGLCYLQVIKFWMQHLHKLASALPATVLQHWSGFSQQASSWLSDAQDRYMAEMLVIPFAITASAMDVFNLYATLKLHNRLHCAADCSIGAGWSLKTASRMSQVWEVLSSVAGHGPSPDRVDIGLSAGLTTCIPLWRMRTF